MELLEEIRLFAEGLGLRNKRKPILQKYSDGTASERISGRPTVPLEAAYRDAGIHSNRDAAALRRWLAIGIVTQEAHESHGFTLHQVWRLRLASALRRLLGMRDREIIRWLGVMDKYAFTSPGLLYDPEHSEGATRDLVTRVDTRIRALLQFRRELLWLLPATDTRPTANLKDTGAWTSLESLVAFGRDRMQFRIKRDAQAKARHAKRMTQRREV